MGQYYNAVLSDGDKILVYETGNEGAKLTEHSYFGGDLVTTATRELYKKPRRIMWCGDYAKTEDFDEIHNRTKALVMPAVADVWGDDAEAHLPNPDGFRDNDKFLVNHDKKEYVDLGEVFELSLEDDTTLHPLPILTAVGNGRGGGDYLVGSDAQKAMVGTWAWDMISVEDEAPAGFNKIFAVFTDDVPCSLGGHLHPDCLL